MINSDEYSCLEFLGFEDRSKFEVLVAVKFAVEHFAIYVRGLVSPAGQ